MATDRNALVIADLRGGRNGDDPPLSLQMNQCADAYNVDWYTATVARKRGGHTDVDTTGTSVTTLPGLTSLIRFGAELWALGMGAATVWQIARLSAAAWSNPSLKDVPTGSGVQRMRGASLKGFLYLAYRSGVDRLHVWDGSTVRRAGLVAQATAPTVADTGAGAYAATIRYYRQRYIELSGSDVIRRSEFSATVTFTPSGAGTAARVTKAAAVSEGETHWELEASADNLVFYRIARTAVGTTTYDDSATPSTYATTGTLSDISGTHSLFPSVDFVIADDNRVLGAYGSAATATRNRVYFTPAIGSLDVGDAERVPNTTSQKNWVDINAGDDDPIVGFGGPINGTVFVFKSQQIWRLTPNGNVSLPYDVRAVSRAVGAVSQESIVTAEDADGTPAVYFMSQRGPYRMGKNGLEFLGTGMLDRISVTPPSSTVFTLWYPLKHQVWFCLGDPNMERYVYDTFLSAWSRHVVTAPSGATITNTYAGVMFSDTIDGLSATLKPYLGGYKYVAGLPVPMLLRGDTSATADDGGTFQAYVKTRAYAPGGLIHHAAVHEGTLTALAGSGVTITVSMIPDFGAQSTRTGTALLTAAGSETRVRKKVTGIELAGLTAVQYQIGDASAVSNGWTVDALAVSVTPQELR